MRKYRLALQTRKRLLVVGGADIIGDFGPLLARWFEKTATGRSVYDDDIVAVCLYQYDPTYNGYVIRGRIPATSKQGAINVIGGMVGM